jgi:iron complex outermembrane receptor protein
MYKLSESLSVYGNLGRTFQVGVGTASYKVNQTSNLAPSINEGWEAGIRFRPSAWLDGRIALWQQTASNEARRKLNDPANDAENIGKTKRQGIDVELNARPSYQLNFWLAGALQRSEILKADSSSLNTEGKEIDHVPRVVYNLGVDYQPTEQLRFSAWANGQSSYYVERTNSQGRFGSYLLANASATYRLSKTAGAELQIRNLFDRYHEYVWWDTTQSLHSPGAGRAIYASLQIRM